VVENITGGGGGIRGPTKRENSFFLHAILELDLPPCKVSRPHLLRHIDGGRNYSEGERMQNILVASRCWRISYSTRSASSQLDAMRFPIYIAGST